MQSITATPNVSRKLQWTGRIISGLCVLFLVFDGVTKVILESHVVQAMSLLGYPGRLTVTLGILVLVCTALYVIPQTSILGAVALTGFLGGATASMLRAGDPGHPFLFPVIFGMMVWLGLYLREDRLHRLLPIRREF